MNRNGGRSITEMIQRSAKKAIKQGEAGLAGKRALFELLDDLLQNDVAAFLKAVGPFVPREIVIDQSISITHALADARSRIINHQSNQSNQSLSNDAAPTLSLDHPQSSLCDAFNLEGGGTGGEGAGLVRGRSS